MILEERNDKNSQFSLNFKHYPLIYKQEIRFGFTDFLVAFGSILALFLGLSILSVFEMLLYLVHILATRLVTKKS